MGAGGLKQRIQTTAFSSSIMNEQIENSIRGFNERAFRTMRLREYTKEFINFSRQNEERKKLLINRTLELAESVRNFLILSRVAPRNGR